MGAPRVVLRLIILRNRVLALHHRAGQRLRVVRLARRQAAVRLVGGHLHPSRRQRQNPLPLPQHGPQVILGALHQSLHPALRPRRRLFLLRIRPFPTKSINLAHRLSVVRKPLRRETMRYQASRVAASTPPKVIIQETIVTTSIRTPTAPRRLSTTTTPTGGIVMIISPLCGQWIYL